MLQSYGRLLSTVRTIYNAEAKIENNLKEKSLLVLIAFT